MASRSSRPGLDTRDITSPKWLYVKGVLFVLCCLLASSLLLVESLTFQSSVGGAQRQLLLSQLGGLILELLREFLRLRK